jgi:hypothetical protein
MMYDGRGETCRPNRQEIRSSIKNRCVNGIFGGSFRLGFHR